MAKQPHFDLDRVFMQDESPAAELAAPISITDLESDKEPIPGAYRDYVPPSGKPLPTESPLHKLYVESQPETCIPEPGVEYRSPEDTIKAMAARKRLIQAETKKILEKEYVNDMAEFEKAKELVARRGTETDDPDGAIRRAKNMVKRGPPIDRKRAKEEATRRVLGKILGGS